MTPPRCDARRHPYRRDAPPATIGAPAGRRRCRWLALVAAWLLVVVAARGPAPAQTFLTVGTGGATGVYLPAGSALCSVVNEGRRRHGLRCTVESTEGSVANIEAIRAGVLDLGAAQSDLAYYAAQGDGTFVGRPPFTELRALFALHPEAFTVVAAADSGVRRLADLRPHRVDLGVAGSGNRASASMVLSALGWSAADFAAARGSSPAEQSEALCRQQIDAFVGMFGHPTGAVQQAIEGCGALLIDVDGPEIEAVIARSPYYRRVIIPAGLYAGIDRDVRTFGVVAILATSARLPETVAYEVVKAVFDSMEDFKGMHPALRGLRLDSMASIDLPVPLHDGARRYLREVGLAR